MVAAGLPKPAQYMANMTEEELKFWNLNGLRKKGEEDDSKKQGKHFRIHIPSLRKTSPTETKRSTSPSADQQAGARRILRSAFGRGNKQQRAGAPARV